MFGFKIMIHFNRISLVLLLSSAWIILLPGMVSSETLLFECSSILADFDYPGYNNIIHVDKSVITAVSNDGTTRQNAYPKIQDALLDANDCDIILIWPGIYNEQLEIHYGKKLLITSAADAAVIKAADPNDYAVSFTAGVTSDVILKNLVIRSSNRGIYCHAASPQLINLTVVDNNVGLDAVFGANPRVYNCIFWNNTEGDIESYGLPLDIRYSCLQNALPNNLHHNVIVNPLFAAPANNDYHLLSRRGRFIRFNSVDAANSDDGWILDQVSSPCIDAGDPRVFPKHEPMPNGGRINMGAYGGTCYASRSEWLIRGDVNYDGIFNLLDFAMLSNHWLSRFDWVNE